MPPHPPRALPMERRIPHSRFDRFKRLRAILPVQTMMTRFLAARADG